MTTGASYLFTNTTLVDADGRRPRAWLLIRDGAIVGTGCGPAPNLADVDVVPLDAGAILTPGFIDLHCHGGGGHDYADPAASIEATLETHLSHGTTRSLASLVTAPIELLELQLDAIGQVTKTSPGLLGAHLEGPFIAPTRCGAHDTSHIVSPEPQTLHRLLTAARGTLRQVTLAPEVPGCDDLIRALINRGVIVAVGHTDATYEQARTAFEGGARVLTHACNAMPVMHHREPGPLLAALEDERVTLEVIADQAHLHPAILRFLLRVAPGRVAVITDAMSAAGCNDGEYTLGDQRATVLDGIARTSSGALAGSTTTQDAELRHLVNSGVNLVTAVASLTSTPARTLGLGSRLGRLRSGMVADVLVLDSSLNVKQVWRSGRATRST